MIRKLPKGWTFAYYGIGVYPSSKQYAVCRGGIYMFAISVDKKGDGARITLDNHLDYIEQREDEIQKRFVD